MSKSFKNLVTGGLGFLGTNLINKLLNNGETVLCIDNCSTGKIGNIKESWNNKSFHFIKHDVLDPIDFNVERIWHLACPASPVHYQLDPVNTARTIFIGTENMLRLAQKYDARILLASSSEVYGNPTIHPQHEDYKGNVKINGIRSCYEEGKRFAESLCYDYQRMYNLEIKIARIFNTYGPEMSIKDGRVVSNFVTQALKNEPITIYGDGMQTRSFCFVEDLIEALIRTMECEYSCPLNLGNPFEISILDLAKMIKLKTSSDSKIIFNPLPEDDPLKRCPNIKKAQNLLKWEPNISLEKGLELTINHFKNKLNLN